jgi:cytidylate kinase
VAVTRLTGPRSRAANRPLVVVTISREFGAGGLPVATAVAAALGYDLLSGDELASAVAGRLGTSAGTVAERTTKAPLGERILERLGAGMLELASPATPRMPDDFDEDVRRELERTIRARAAAGNVVILGKNAGVVLGAAPDVLRVFLIAEREWRVARLAAFFKQSLENARADLERVDAGRKRFTRERYGVRWGDAHLYDLTIDVSRMSIEGAVELAVAAVRARARA